MKNRKPKNPPKPRRARGTGANFWSPTLRLWVGRVKVGTRYLERRASTQAQLQAKLAAIAPPGPTTTVAEWAERWFRGLASSPATRDDYRHTLDRFVLPTLGHFRVSELTAYDVEAAVTKWAKMPRKDRRGNTVAGGLGGNTARKNLGQFRECLEAARRSRLIADNPARDARKPRRKKVTIDPFTPDELLCIIQSPKAGIFALLASVGCRLGEAVALDVSDFDATTGTVSITKTYTRKHGTRPPKSENGVRTIRVPKHALPAVLACAGARLRGPLFPSARGTRREHTGVRQAFRRLCVRLGVRPRKPHQMRHGVATAMVSAGVPIGDVAKFLGDSPATIVSTYLHPAGTDPAAAMESVWG